jgi:hypothetical protein
LLGTATLEIELGGLNAGSDYDRLTVAGEMALDGIADVNLINNFDPVLGDIFDVVVADSIIDNGINYDFPNLSGGRFFQAGIVHTVSDDRLRFAVVPEPGSITLVVLGGVVLLRRRRTRE